MRFNGILRNWNDSRGFGTIDSTQGGEPIFVHVSAWSKGSARPTLEQLVSYEVESGPKGKRAIKVQVIQARPLRRRSGRANRARWGVAALVSLPAFLLLYLVMTILWRPPLWVGEVYLATSAATFVVYALDKWYSRNGGRRISERTLHLLALSGGWPGALIAQQIFRHKTVKEEFRQVFWITVAANVIALIVVVSPLRQVLVSALWGLPN
ncbi:cold shock and DUF1294 domain-containing protein [Actimicrobium antarcticum]|uniref:cold shock and DUF1294 domain-containing protein n=1 Tax=Actimicrobium antarcticum TaxID=1051899 RepID=UPI0031D7AB5C